MSTKIIWLQNLMQNKQTPRKSHSPYLTKGTEENPNFYFEGGYHPVKIGDTYHNRYTVLRKLGWGQFSTVWLGWDQQNSLFIALKIFRSARTYTDVAAREIEFLNRAQQCQSNNNPRKVVQLLDHFFISGINGTHTCVVFEALGHNLTEVIKRSKKGFPLTSVKSILRQILESLHFLHTSCNVVHTDVKPDNVCVDDNQVCRFAFAAWEKAGLELPFRRGKVDAGCEVPVTLVDLGNANWAEDELYGVIQTPAYRSPEVILGCGFRANADVWSAACMGFELATGHHLFSPYSKDESLSDDEYHLVLVERLLGDVPKGMVFASAYSSKFFTAEGKVRCGGAVETCGLFERLTGEFGWDAREARQFAEFLLPMLEIDPKCRCSAKDCLDHKWLEL